MGNASSALWQCKPYLKPREDKLSCSGDLQVMSQALATRGLVITVLLDVFVLFLGILGFMFGLNSGHFSNRKLWMQAVFLFEPQSQLPLMRCDTNYPGQLSQELRDMVWDVEERQDFPSKLSTPSRSYSRNCPNWLGLCFHRVGVWVNLILFLLSPVLCDNN